MDIKKIGQFIREQRTKRGYTQGQLADILQVSHQAVSRWENGDNLPDVEKLSELSVLFNVSIDEIVSHGLDLPQKKHRHSTDLNYYFMIHVILSVLSIIVYYALYLATGNLSVPIIVQYVTVLGSSLLYIIPYGKLEHKTIDDYRRVKYGIMITIGAFTWTMHTFLSSFMMTESIAIWLLIEGLLQLILLWILTVIQSHSFAQPFELSKGFIRFLLSFVYGTLILVVLVLTANTLNRLNDWGETFEIIYSGVLVIVVSTVLGIGIRQLIKRFDFIVLSLLLAYLFVSYQIYYIVYWTLSDYFHYLAIQSVRSVHMVYQDMYIWFIGIFLFNIVSLVVLYLTEKDKFFSHWLKYAPFVVLMILHELILLFSQVHIDVLSTDDHSQRIFYDFGAGAVFIVFEIVLLIYYIWNRFDFKPQKKTSIK